MVTATSRAPSRPTSPRDAAPVQRSATASGARSIASQAGSFAAGELALTPRENLVQMKAGGGQAKTGGGATQADIKADLDRAFYAWWDHFGRTKENIPKAEAKVREKAEGGMPKDWVAPPLRGTGRLPESPNYQPDASNSSQAPGPCDEPDYTTGETRADGAGPAPTGGAAPPMTAGNSVSGSAKPAVTEDSTPADTPGALEVPLRKVNVLGGAELGLKVDGTGAVELSLVKKNGNPIAVQAQTPIPGVYAEGEVEWKAGIFGKGGGGKFELGGVAAADLRVTMNVGVPKVMSAYAGLKLSTELKLTLSGTYDIDKGELPTVTDGGLSANLSGAFIVGGKLDQAGWRLEKEFGKTEFGTLSWMYSSGQPQVTPSAEVRKALEAAQAKLKQAKEAGETIVGGAKDAAGWVWDNVVPGGSKALTEEEQAERDRVDSHADTDDGTSGGHA